MVRHHSRNVNLMDTDIVTDTVMVDGTCEQALAVEKKTKSNYGLFPPTETETDPCTESFPDRYIVLCRTFSTGMETEMGTETFPNHYCTHFRDRSPSQGQISIPILLYFNKGIGICLRTSGKTCLVH